MSETQHKNTKLTKITEERFDGLLNILPPCKWVKAGLCEAFHLSERLHNDIALWCVRFGDEHYMFEGSDRQTAYDAIDYMIEQIADEP